MAPSSSEPGVAFIVRLDRIALAGLVAGLVCYVMPLWAEGRLRLAFWLTLFSTALHIYTSHARHASQTRLRAAEFRTAQVPPASSLRAEGGSE